MGFERDQRGLKQGDPISPFLFSIVMEVLCYLVSRVVDVGGLLGCKIVDEAISIILLQFADNSLFFIPKKNSKIHNLRSILLIFEAISSMMINLLKNKLYAIPDDQDANQFAG